jgi:sugar O-acyltransferase (sialic acid O-acetyltransferase NeuD family)
MKKVLIIGGEGSGSVIGDSIIDANRRGDREFEFVGFINDRDNVNEIMGKPVLGGLKDVGRFIDAGYYFVYTLYKFDCQIERIALFDSLNIPDNRLVTFVHPTAYVAHNVELSPGCIIMPNVSITSKTKLGKSCCVRPGATIGHNNDIGDHTSIIAGASIGSCIKIGKGGFIGLKSCVREYTRIGQYSMVGMGAVVVKDIGEGELWVGNPAKFLRKALWQKIS